MKQIKFSLLLIIVSFSLSAQTFSFKIRVTDIDSNAPLSDAHVMIYTDNGLHQQGVTGKDGIIICNELPGDKAEIIISYVGYKLFETEIDARLITAGLITLGLTVSPVPVGEITVSTLRRDLLLRNISLPMVVMTGASLERTTAFSMSDAISSESGVALARDGIWGTSINIRGLSENRIISLIDGNRIETSTDLAAGLSLIDVNDIERIEVIKGAASSIYGTGALGGVVNIITKKGRYNDDFYAEGSITGSYHSVNSMHSEYITAGLGNSSWYARFSGTLRNAENTMTPGGELENSQFTDNNLSAKIGFKPISDHELQLNYQRFYARDVGIPGGKAFPASATATYPRELREMMAISYDISNIGVKLDELKIKYFHQYILRDVILRPNQNVKITPSGYHITDGIHLQTGWNAGKNNYLIAGTDLWQRHLRTERERNIIQGENNIIIGEIPIPESWYRSGGAFFQNEASLLQGKLKITLGGRLDLIHVRNEDVVDPIYRIVNDVRNDNPPNQRNTFMKGNINSISWSSDIGLLFNVNNTTDISFTASRAFRSPSLDERFKYIDLGATVRLGNPELKPEQGYFFDLGTKIWKDKFQFSANLFINMMSDMIVELPGEAVFPLAAFPDSSVTVSALINSNVDKATLYGFDVSTHYNIYNSIVLFGSVSFVRGKDVLNNKNLPLIPPLNSRTGIRYTNPKWFGAEMVVNMSANQLKTAEGETETKGYAYYSLNLFSVPCKVGFMNVTFFAGIENITDRAYINHLATNRGFIRYEPGRNIFARLRIGF